MKRVLFACLIFSFSLALASGQNISVTKPAADETWVKGQSYAIQWTKQGTLPDTVRITLRDSGGTALVQLIANAAPNTGTFSWTVPSTLADGAYRIKVKATDVAIEALSGIFTIGSSSEGLHPRFKAVRKGTLNLQVAPSVKVLKPSSGDAYHQLDTITIQVQANTGPADGSGDGFDLDLYNETGTARVTDILSGGMSQTAPGVYSFAWAMPRMDSVPDARYTIRARSWNRNITGLSAPFWIRIPGTEEKVAVEAVIDSNWSWKKEPSGSAPAEHVAAERPGEARIGWYNSAGDDGTPYMGVVLQGADAVPYGLAQGQTAPVHKSEPQAETDELRRPPQRRRPSLDDRQAHGPRRLLERFLEHPRSVLQGGPDHRRCGLDVRHHGPRPGVG